MVDMLRLLLMNSFALKKHELAMPQEVTRPTYAAIDRQALMHNVQIIRQQIGPRCRVLAVVKADGYGHGAVTSARAFLRAGAWGFVVSLVEEGLELRQAGLLAPILVLGGLHQGSVDQMIQKSLTPVIWQAEQLKVLTAAAQRHGQSPISVHLKIDTGMSRLGIIPAELSSFADELLQHSESVRVEGVMTHLACADEVDESVSIQQLQQFSGSLQALAARGIRPQLRHVCNSAGILRLPEGHYDAVRPGIALYGSASADSVRITGLRSVMSLHSQVLGLRSLPAGTKISYGHTHTLTRPSRLAIIPVGYADGYPRSMSCQAQVLVGGQRCRVLGKITMDFLLADVSDVPSVHEGTEVTLLGTQAQECIVVEELATWAGVLPYEVLCGVSKRVPRYLL